MAYKSDGGPKGGQTAKDRKAGDVGGRGGAGGVGGQRGGADRGGGIKASGKVELKDLDPSTPGFGALGPRGPQVGWGSDPDFERAMSEYDDRTIIDRALDFLAGGWYDAVKPEPLSPKTYAGGTYHSGTHVPSALGGLIGGVLGGPLGGQVVGGVAGMIPGGTVMHGGDPALAGYNTGTGPMSPGAPQGGGTGQGGQYANLVQGGPLAPKPGVATPATPAGPMSPGPLQMGANWLSVPGGNPYGIATPAYRYPRAGAS